MKKQNAVLISVFCAGFLLFPLVSFGAKEAPQSATGAAVSSNVEQGGQASGSEQEEIKNVNQNSGETQNKETEKEQVSNQNGNSGSGTEVNSQNQANVSEGGDDKVDIVGSANQNQNKVQNNQGEVLGQSKEEKNQRSLERRSQVAVAIMEMERIGDSNQGIGEQVRVIAQSQNEGQDRVETTLQTVQNRNRVVKFLVGPDYKKIKDIEAELETQQTRIQEMVRLANQLENEGDAQAMMEQIALLQDVEDQIRQELENEQVGVSLFGWLFRWFAK
jgi:hypothetical protein